MIAGRPVDARELHRRLDRLGAAVRQERAPRPTRQQAGQPVVQPQPGLVVHDVLLAVQKLDGLSGDRGCDPRMSVSRACHTDARRIVQVALAIAGDEPRPLAAVDVEVSDPAPDRGDDRVVGEGSRRDGGLGRFGLQHATCLPVLGGGDRRRVAASARV